MNIRPLNPAEAQRLTDIALRAKAYWGYDDAFMNDARRELALSAEDIGRLVAYGLEIYGRLAGFYTLNRLTDEKIELRDLWLPNSSARVAVASSGHMPLLTPWKRLSRTRTNRRSQC